MRKAGAAIHLTRVHKGYGAVAAVRDLSLEVRAGEFLTLLGSSGCGKTTTLMLIAGFETPDSGEIVIDGRATTRVPPHLREQGFVFQHYALFPHMTVRQNLAYPLRVRGVAASEIAARIERTLDRFGLRELADRFPRQLSGGQQQRTALARALIHDPPLVLMDEPLAALDRNLRTQCQQEIKSIQREFAVTIVYVTHDQEEALTMSDRVAIMNGGRIEQLDAPEALYERPATEFVARFMGEMNFLDATVSANDGSTLYASSDGGLRLALPADELRESAQGDRLKLCIRPEKLRLAREAERGGPWIEGVVDKRVYLGESERYHLEVAGHALTARQQVAPGAPRFEPGERVSVSWLERDLRVVGPAGG
jgi:putative spermidine/putrescine transport system ATP-binding protein